jgi:hypothetical protein
MKKIITVFGTFVVVTLIFFGLTNMDEIKAYINNKEVNGESLTLIETSESSEVSEDEGSDVEAFVETDSTHQTFSATDGQRPERRTPPAGDGTRPAPPDGVTAPNGDTQTGATTTTE